MINETGQLFCRFPQAASAAPVRLAGPQREFIDNVELRAFRRIFNLSLSSKAAGRVSLREVPCLWDALGLGHDLIAASGGPLQIIALLQTGVGRSNDSRRTLDANL